jgi:hypothetical protein
MADKRNAAANGIRQVCYAYRQEVSMSSLLKVLLGQQAPLPACFLVAAALATAAGPAAVADIHFTSGQIRWDTKVDAGKWVLTVSGQGLHYREIVENRVSPAFQIVAPDGERLPDGSYKWELRAIGPEAPDSVAEGDERPGSVRQRAGLRGATFDRRVIERPIVEFGSFRVENGAFIAPEPEPDETGTPISGAR